MRAWGRWWPSISAATSVEVTVAPDGERGLAALARRRFDAVLLDVMLPGIDGFEVCRRMRARPERPTVPIIMLTARGEDVDRIVGLEIGRRRLPRRNPSIPASCSRASVPSCVERRRRRRPAGRLRVGGLEIDWDAREVALGGVRSC